MTRKQFLWLHPRGADCYYLAANNIKAAAGERGTLLVWQWPFWRGDDPDRFWHLQFDDTNYMNCWLQRSFRVVSQGVAYSAVVERTTAQYRWELLVYTWDFTPPAGQCVTKVYWNGNLAAQRTDVRAPVGTPQRLYLGPAMNQETKGAHMIYGLAVWDDVMSAEQVAALWAEGFRYVPRASDGTGNLLLLASYNQRYDADIAAGDPHLYVNGPADHYCLVNDGAIEWRRRRFLIGTPRHDFSEDDRVPVCVPCPTWLDFGRAPYVADANYTNYGEIQALPGYSSERGIGSMVQGAPVFDGSFLNPGSTYRQRVHLPRGENPLGRHIRLGPVDYYHAPTKASDVYDQWGSGRRFSVVADGGNSATQFKTDLSDVFDDGYWVGAWVQMLTGTCAGRRLKVTGYTKATKVIVVEGSFPAVPQGGDVGIVDHRARLVGVSSRNDAYMGTRQNDMNVDAWLWEFHGGSKYFTELEYQFSDYNTTDRYVANCLRYERGRTALLDGAPRPGDSWGLYGKAAFHESNTLSCKILLERIEVDGPGTYQLLRRTLGGIGPDFADNFMVLSADGHSTKVWRARDVRLMKTRPTKIASPSSVKGDLEASGTWRHTVSSWPIPVLWEGTGERVIAALVGTDASGVSRIGYVVGEWDGQTGRIRWEDETPPAGKSNPFLLHSELRPARESDAPTSAADLINILQTEDGKWALVYNTKTSEPDHLMTYLLYGAEDRWSFSRAAHWWEGNPVAPILGGPDLVCPDGDGYGTWANRDAGWYILQNPYTHDPARRYIGHARGKSINHRQTGYAWDLRPTIGIRGSDLRAMTPLPHGNSVTPLAGPLIHMHEGAVLEQGDCIGLYTDTAIAFSSGVFAYVSEDGVHFQLFATDSNWIPRSELPGEPSRLYPGRPFRLGDKRIYYYGAGGWLNFAWVRLNGESWYELQPGKTAGMVETSAIERPADGWGRLWLNASPESGQLAVEVVDCRTEEVVPGFSAAEYGGVTDSVQQEALWNGRGLQAVQADTIRLRFVFSGGTGTSPRLYAWKISDPELPAPTVVGVAPTGTGVATSAQVEVRFSAPMDRASVEEAFGMVPAVPGGFLWSDQDRVVVFVPDGELAEGAQYTVSIAGEARSREGVTLQGPYEWSFTTLQRPIASDLRVEGMTDPTNVLTPTPEFSWKYSDEGGREQAAYQLMVCSTREKLKAHVGDVWDTGEVSGDATQVTYSGSGLQSDTLYYWSVRVRNSEGVWSEEW